MPTKPLSKLGTRYQDIKDIMGWRSYDPGKKWAASIAQDLLDFANDPTTIDFIEFFIWYGIIKQTYYKLRTKYDVIYEAHEIAKIMFAARREKRALEKELDPGMMQRTLHQYHPAWRASVDEERAFKKKLKEQEAQHERGGDFVVKMVDFSEK